MTIRNGPHKTYPSLGTYQVNSRVEILEFRFFMGELWGRTDKGWILVDHYVMLDDGDNLVNTFYITVKTSSLYVRTGPGSDYGSVRTFKYGAELEILALKEVDGGVWGRIYCGWISLKYTNYVPSMVPDQTPRDDCATVGHTYVDTVTAPTCDAAGYTTHLCEKCGHSYTDTEVAATGHSYVDSVVAPGCETAGYTAHTCSKCGHSYTDTEVAATGHSYVDTVKVPTCTEPGFTTHTCETCGYSYKDTEVAAKGHDYASVVTAPTTQDKGYTTHTCKNCGHSYVDSYTDPVKDTVTETVTKIYATITGGMVNVRKGPGASYGAVTTLHRGAVVEILEQKNVDGKIWGRYEGGWFRITGYATLETVVLEVEVPGTEKPTEPEKPVEPEDPEKPEEPTAPEVPEIETTTKIYATITGGSVNVRKGPGASYGAVTVIRRGDVVEILEQKEVDGKIWGRYEGGWFRITGYATLETKEESNTTMTVNTDRLNVRKGAGMGYDIVGSLSFGTKVTIYEIVTVDGVNWARTEHGWVSMEYLK
jgi:uncharacterized protein YraI